MKVCEQLKQARLQEQLTQQVVAETLNVSRQTISSWETGRSYPDIASLITLSDYYDLSLDTLMKDDEGVKTYLKKKDVLKQLNPIATLLMGIDVLFMVPLLFNISQGVDHIIVFLMGMINIIALMSVLIIIAGLLPESEKIDKWSRQRGYIFLLAVVCFVAGALFIWVHWMTFANGLILMFVPIGVVGIKEASYIRYKSHNS